MRTVWRAFFGASLIFAISSAPRIVVAEPAIVYDPDVSSRTFSVTPGTDGAHDGVIVNNDVGCPTETVVPHDVCSCHLCPRTYVWVDALILARENSADEQPLVLDLNDNEVLFSTDDFDFDTDSGVRIGYGGRFCDCWGGEIVYMGVFEPSDSAYVEREDSLMLPGALGLQVNNFFGADRVDVNYSSDLHSIEANLLRCRCCRDCCADGRSMEWLAGFRYLNLDEDFSISSYDSDESTTVFEVDTENNLYGAQFGGRHRRCSGCFGCETTLKAGVFANDVEQSQSPIIDFPDFLFREGRSSDDVQAAFVGDLNFTLIWQFCELWGLRAGYNLIWLEGVALAPDQLDFTNTPDSGRNLDADGGVFLHGVNLGLESRW
jgi:hypothetical protein